MTMLHVRSVASASLLALTSGLACAQWVGPSAPDSRMKFETGPVYVGVTSLTSARFGVIEPATSSRVIGSYAFAGTPTNGNRTTAIWGETNNPKGRALQGFNFATAPSGDANNPATGIWAEVASSTGVGLRARATSTTGVSYAANFDNASEIGYGVYTTAPSFPLYAVATTTSLASYAVWARTFSTMGAAVFGQAEAANGTTAAIMGISSSSNGYAGYFQGGQNYFENNVGIGTSSPATKLDVTGTSTTGLILATNSSTAAGSTTGASVAGVKGVISAASPGTHAAGVWGVASTTSSSQGYGVAGYHAQNNAVGLAGFIATGGFGVGVLGKSGGSTSYAGFFDGNVQVLGTLAKSGGSFKIDHPLDPANKTLSHSFVESPDMMNVYNGVVQTDPSGYATVTMPEWFETLNRDFRYQLTIIDEADTGWALAKVVREMNNNEFTIRTNLPNQKVSWQVTGIRQDKWANANRIPVEQDKPAHERGKYLNPREFGQPDTLGIMYRDTSGFAKEAAQMNERQAQAAKENAEVVKQNRVRPATAQPAASNPAPLTPAIAGGH
jgi:hypothetical protein